MTATSPYPAIRIQPGQSRRVRTGHPWIFSNELVMDEAAKALPPGGLARVVDAGDEVLGVGTFNPHSLISVRMLTRDPTAVIDVDFLTRRVEKALALRRELFAGPFYRLAHAEADGFPGLVVDRFGEVITLEANTAGMERLLDDLLAALERVLNPSAILVKNDSAARRLEGLDTYERVVKGSLDGPVTVEENGARYLADLATGQKTGWFYDQRDNRAAVARLCKGRTVADFYSYAGGFAVLAALAGATATVAVDGSEAALALAAASAKLNGVGVDTVKAECFAEMARLATEGKRFGVVVADPPAFVKSKKDLAAGAKGYRKMTRLAAQLVEPGGFLFVASCSHHMGVDAFAEEVRHGLSLAGRDGRILRSAGAASDHPVHPALPASAYLKSLLLQLD
jgi:23S rRNA (cytosine1962-C5)-methyltransferase